VGTASNAARGCCPTQAILLGKNGAGQIAPPPQLAPLISAAGPWQTVISPTRTSSASAFWSLEDRSLRAKFRPTYIIKIGLSPFNHQICQKKLVFFGKKYSVLKPISV